MSQAFYDGFPWKIHRNKRGWPRWWQRWYEAWLVITGKYTFWHAWDHGKHIGAAMEYDRVVRNGGDLMPLLDAAINELCPEEMTVETFRERRRDIWARYKAVQAPAETIG